MSLMLLSLLVAGPVAAPAATAPAPMVQSRAPVRDVAVSNPLRRVLMETLRETIADDLGQPVQFVVDTLRAEDRNWAFYSGHVQQPNGRPIDFSRTRYAEALEEGMFDGPTTYALFSYNNGSWRVVTFVVGPTDVPYVGWSDEFNAPAALFE
ncbi:hypothetical protein MMB232_01533 [Brevundimonas subvibrioides]|uniref:hypothetical protein n=1 Tax=Brevundimonas subvibrioides TaxID=74313 RepID=UPI0032D574AD